MKGASNAALLEDGPNQYIWAIRCAIRFETITQIINRYSCI